MSVALLDVNILIALLWPKHEHRKIAENWFVPNRHLRWATCAITEAGFIRLSRSAVAGASIQHYMKVLDGACSASDHEFWPLDTPLGGIQTEIRQRLMGHGQITDAILLDLAIRRGGRLVTLDRRIRHLLPADSPHQASIEVIG